MATPSPRPDFEPFIPADTKLREFTWRSILVGTVLGMVFGASSLYLVLRVGLTVSASIPVAVISLTIFRLLSKLGIRDSTILENNLTQTAGSAGESIAFGVGVTMPAIMILGFDLELTRVLLVGVLGGLLGILMMIPLRRALIVKEHGTLKYPEGTACAAVLKAGATEECRAAASPAGQEEIRAAQAAGLGKAPGAKVIFTGFGIGLVYKAAMSAFKAWKDTPTKVFSAPFAGASIASDVSPELVGVGYVIGPRISAIMCAGGVLSYLVLIPMIKYFGEHLSAPLSPATIPISQMDIDQIHGNYVLYIGAGAVAAGGIISLLRSLPTIWHGLRAGLHDVGMTRLSNGTAKSDKPRSRLDRDLSIKFVGIGIVVLIAGIVLAPSLHMNLLGALLIIVFGFLFVTVSSRLTGEIGSTSNPISGMTIATLLLTCLIFMVMGWVGHGYYVTALSVGAIVCIASSNGGTTSQDLKTGFLIGATPRYQQIAILFGAFASALIMGPILLTLNQNATVYVPIAQVAPAGLSTNPSELSVHERIEGPQASSDTHDYLVWHKTDELGGPEGKYLVDGSGHAVWLVDPGINGVYTQRPDGSTVTKLYAPKATLVSYIIKGLLNHQLPWSLVLLGVMIAFTLELSGIPSLAFAVGVYLPLSASAPLMVGGGVRWIVDRIKRKEPGYRELSEEQFMAESDKSPGVLLSSGYIAGGAIAGIVIAYVSGVDVKLDTAVTRWATTHNPFYAGPHADALSLIPLTVLALFLYFVAREKLLGPSKKAGRKA